MVQAVRFSGVPLRVVADPDNEGVYILAVIMVDSQGNVVDGSGTTMETFGSEPITVTATPIGPTASIYAPDGETPASQALVAVTTEGVFLQYDGSEVSASDGIPLSAGAVWEVNGVDDVENIRLVRSGGNDAEVFLLYRRVKS